MSLLATAILALVLASSAMAQSEVRVDDDHMQIGDHAKAKLSYAVAAGPALWLDFTGYRFSLWPKEEPPPDFISVVVGKGRYFVPLVHGKTRYLISNETAKSSDSVLPFPGFTRGTEAMVAIGRRRYDPVKREDVLRVHWLGMVEVK
jgi:hypothetical protein